MNQLIAIPPLVRTIVYYTLGVALVVCLSLKATGLGPQDWVDFGQQVSSGLSALFLGVAAANVVGNKTVSLRSREDVE